MPQTNRPEVFDAVVVGAGAGGGTTARVLTAKGMKVALIEAGPEIVPSRDYLEHKWPYDFGHRGAEEGGKAYFGQGKPFGFFTTTSGDWHLEGEPYTTGKGTEFMWFRSRVVGGRTNHYGRMSFRFSQLDLKPYDRDGLGWNWPIDYADIAPYYDKAEEYIGVTGDKHGIPSAPDGIFHTPPPPKAHEVLVRAYAKKMGIPFIANRRAVLTHAINGRPACHYCGQCGRGCVTASNYSASQVDVFPALKTGNLTLITEAMAREVHTDGKGKATGVLYIDKKTRSENFVRGRAVILGASTCESARILLNSKSAEFPNGVANGSGLVGRYLMDTIGASVSGTVPALEGIPRYNTDGFGGAHLYAPWWLWDQHSKIGFPRGYHIEMGGGFGMPGIGAFGRETREAGYGLKLKQLVREKYGSSLGFAGRGEMIPNNQSYCEIDPDVVDRWGIPVLKFHFRFSDYEKKQAEHMVATFTYLIESMGGRASQHRRSDGEVISVPGEIIHEVGTVRMGTNAGNSVLNKFNQAHEVKNLFVNDGASFVSNPDKNPTLTISALAWRASDYLAEEMRKGNV
jgi:choline dehydrogenase-like flavoprotein